MSEGVSTLKVSENNGNSVFVEMLRGRDGEMGPKVLPDPLDLLAPLAPAVGVPSTPGGGRAPVHK